MIPNQKNQVIRKKILSHFEEYALSGKWGQSYTQNINYGFINRREVFKDLIVKLAPKTVADIGCGTGNYTEILPDSVSEYLGLDFSKKMIKEAKNKYKNKNYNFRVFDIMTDNIKKKYDVIVASGLLEYFDEPIIVLNRIRKMMHKESKLIFQVPNKDCFYWKGKKYQSSPNKDFYHNRFSVPEIKNIISKSNFNLNEVKYYSHNFFPLSRNFPKITYQLDKYLRVLVPAILSNIIAQNIVVVCDFK